MCENIFIKNELSESGDQAEYLSGLFYHEVKVWDRNKGEVFDLTLGWGLVKLSQ
ncbi:hypothetical protein AND4_07829 [Vibrio sp. AND4]|nr:hypothetical protein AND4_07829 [Vibrio sp. AND4]